jgi:hypothetical protein
MIKMCNMGCKGLMISDDDTDPYYLINSAWTNDVLVYFSCSFDSVNFDMIECAYDKARIACRSVLVKLTRDRPLVEREKAVWLTLS